MTHPIAIIGPATLDMIGVGPTGFSETMEANWPGRPVFGGAPFYQPTGQGDRREVVSLACRPHVFGGIENYRALQRVCMAQLPVPFIRMSGLLGGYQGLVAVARLSKEETKIAPDGVGWRWEFTAELLYIGEMAGMGF